MPRVLLATDADWIHEEVDAAIAGDDIDVIRVNRGVDVRPVVTDGGIDLVVLDLQIGNMGGMATCMDLHLDESVGKLEHTPVLMLLDRDVDRFLAERANADGWVIKPVDPFELRRAATSLLAGGTWRTDASDSGDAEGSPTEGDDAPTGPETDAPVEAPPEPAAEEADQEPTPSG